MLTNGRERVWEVIAAEMGVVEMIENELCQKLMLKYGLKPNFHEMAWPPLVSQGPNPALRRKALWWVIFGPFHLLAHLLVKSNKNS